MQEKFYVQVISTRLRSSVAQCLGQEFDVCLLVLSDLLETAADPRLVAGIKESLIVKLVKSLVVEVVLEVLQRKSELEHLGI